MKALQLLLHDSKEIAVRTSESGHPRHVLRPMERLTAFIMTTLLLLFVSSCEKINDLIDRPKEPQSVAEGLPGVWEVSAIHYLPGLYKVYNQESGDWKEIRRGDSIVNIEKKSPDYFIVKISDSTMTLLSGGKNLGLALMREYPYQLEQDSIITGGIFRSDYENSTWMVKEMKRSSFKIVCSESGRLFNDSEPTDTLAETLSRVISMRRLK